VKWSALSVMVCLAMTGTEAAAAEAPREVAGPVRLALGTGESFTMLKIARRPAPPEVTGAGGVLVIMFFDGVLPPGANDKGVEQSRRKSTALFAAFRPWAASQDIGRVVVSALMGALDSDGVVVSTEWTRVGPQAWERRDKEPGRVRIPGNRSLLASKSDARLEVAAVRCGARFLAAVDNGNLDEAWGLTSPGFRTVSRAKFDEAMHLMASALGTEAKRTHAATMYSWPASRGGDAAVQVRFNTNKGDAEGYQDVLLGCESNGHCAVLQYDYRVPRSP
jgi:hypothetical protein